MKRIPIILMAGVFILSACGATGDIEIHDPWARPTEQGENAAIYFQLHNHSQSAEVLTGASSNVADALEIHESKLVNDVMQMNMVSSVPFLAGEEIIFAPGGYHIMLVGIKQEFKAGDHIGVILHFKNHGDIVVNVSVGDQPANSEEHNHK